MMYPTNKFNSVNIEQVSDTRVGEPRLFRNRSYGNKDPYWLITMVTPPLPYSEGMGLAAFLDSLLGAFEKFDLPCPVPQISSNPNSYLSANAIKGTTYLNVVTPNDVKAGDFVQFSGNKKVYRITEDSLGAGTKTIKITPPLVESIPTAPTTMLYGDDVVFQVSLEDRSAGEITAERGKFIIHDVELIEQQ